MTEDARKMWSERLAFLQAEEPKLSDPGQRFGIAMQIREARDKLAELDGHVPDGLDHRPSRPLTPTREPAVARIKIFVCYRREDSATATGRIYDRLESQFPDGQVFMDVDRIPLGEDFRQCLDREIRGSHLVLVVIGRDWLNGRRLDAADDYVRTEIEIALAQDILLIPILLDDVAMPAETELPDGIKPLAHRQAARVHAAGNLFRSDMERLIRHIQQRFVPVGPDPEPMTSSGPAAQPIDPPRGTGHTPRPNVLPLAPSHQGVERFVGL